MEKDLGKLEKNIDIKFNNIDLLRQALVHRSFINENKSFPLDHNERLEFLGDAVLELVVTDYLYLNYPNPEGELTNWRSALVNSVMLSSRSQELGINDYLYLSRGEAKDTGKAREIILANAFEALIGAIYIDQGYEKAKEFITDQIIAELPRILELGLYMDPKSKLQEKVQEYFSITPSYQVEDEWGPDHAKKFKVGVFIEDKKIGEGEGPSKQEAQVAAAEDALANDQWKK